MSEYDPTADPIPIESTDQGNWISDQLRKLEEIAQRKKELEGEREVIQAELIPVIEKTGRPIMYIGSDGRSKVAARVAAERMTVDLDKLEELVPAHYLATLPVKRSVEREVFEHWCFINNIGLEDVGPAVKVKTSKAYVHLG